MALQQEAKDVFESTKEMTEEEKKKYMVNDYEFYVCQQTKKLEVGKRYLVRSKAAVSPLTENGGIYPWGSVSTKIPVEVLEEHRNFYTVRVLPHYAHFANFGKSKPYVVSIMKQDILLDEVRCYITATDLVCEREDLT